MAAKTTWDKHPVPTLTSQSGSELPAAVREWRKSAAQATAAATKGQWLMELIKSLKRPKNSLTAISLLANDGAGSKRIDILAKFESTEATRETVVSRAMKCKAPIHAEAWDDVSKDKVKIEAAFDQLCVYMNEFNFQMTKATAKAAPAQHAIAEAKYDDDLGNPFGGIAVYFLLTSTAEKHEQKRLDTMLEQLGDYVASDCKRAVDVGGYLERIHIQYLDLVKAKENLGVLHSRILPKVLSKLSDGRHVGSDRLDCAEWQQLGIKAAEWQVLRDEDASKISWDDVYLDLVTTYEHIVTHRTRTYGGDPTGPAGRNVKFPVGVGFQSFDMDASEDGENEHDFSLAVYQSTFGNPATVEDYTKLVEHRTPLPGSARTTFFNGVKKYEQYADKKMGSANNPRRQYKTEPERPNMPAWECGACNVRNFYYVTVRPGTAVRDKCFKCKQPKKASHARDVGKPRVANEPHLGAAAIEKLIEERVASGVQQALDAQKSFNESALAGFVQDDCSGNAFSLGLGGIVTGSISSIEDDETRIPDDGEAIVDQFGNNADAYMRRSASYNEALVHQIAVKSWLVMLLSGIHTFASTITNRLGQTCNDAMSWVAPAAGGRHTTTAGVCILLACCVMFAQLASTQTLSPHTNNAIAARHAIENWGIEALQSNVTRYGVFCFFFKRMAQGYQQYCLQAATGFAKGQLFLDSGASTTLIHDASMLTNVRRLPEPKMVMGLTGPQAIKFKGDLCLNMLNTTGGSSQIVVKDVYYDPALQYNLVSVTDISRTGHVTTFSTDSNQVTGPAGAFELIKTCGGYAMPVVSGTALAAFGASNMTEEELMHLRMNHCVSYTKMQVLSKSGARGVNPQLKCTKRQCNICVHANITRNPAPPALATNQRVYGQEYTPSIQLEQLSLYHDMPNPTVANIIERLQSTAVPCNTAWNLHDLLQLTATIEEQRPLDLEAMRSGDAEHGDSGESPSVTIGPAGSSDGDLEGFLPSYKAQNTVFVNGSPAPYGTLTPSWRDAGSKTVKQVDNSALAEYLIGSEAKIVLPESYWPKDKVSWTTQCMDHRENKRAKGNHTFKCVLLESKSRYMGANGGASTYEAELSAWHVRNALELQHGGHKTLDEIFGGETRGLFGLATDRLRSVVKNTATRMSSACDKEIKKLFEMGTFSIVDENDIPPGHKSINCCMSFKIKKDGDGNILEYRARCNADGRQQEVGSYGDTSAPTSKFRLMIMIFIYSSIHDL
jgi:hypothetical protein